jgi:hypothetical protein
VVEDEVLPVLNCLINYHVMKNIENGGIAPHILTHGDDGCEPSASYLGHLVQGGKSCQCPLVPRAGLNMIKIKISISFNNRTEPLIIYPIA